MHGSPKILKRDGFPWSQSTYLPNMNKSDVSSTNGVNLNFCVAKDGIPRATSCHESTFERRLV